MGCYLMSGKKKKLLSLADKIYNYTVDDKIREAMGECIQYIREAVQDDVRR